MRKTIIATIVCLIVIATVVLASGNILSAPAKSTIGSPPRKLAAQTITILDPRGLAIHGWFSPGVSGKGSILLLHGVRSNRRQMLGRAIFLQDLGYSVLLIDLQAHGESDGSRITFGYRESDGVKAAINYLRVRNKSEPIGVIGVSLGAASFVLSGTTPPPNAVILESMYPTIDEAVADRLRFRLGSFGPLLSPLLLDQMKIWLGINASQLRPIDHIASIGAPVLIISGTKDRHTTVTETKRLFDAAVKPKKLWLIDGAAHVDLYAYSPASYKKAITEFLRTNMAIKG